MRRLEISLALSFFTAFPLFVEAKTHELLIRPKNESTAQLHHLEVGKVYRKVCNSESECETFAQKLDKKSFDFEKPVKFRGDTIEINDSSGANGSNPPPAIEGVPLSGNEWSLFPVASDAGHVSGADIDVKRAWTIVKGSPHVYVFVMDSGIDDRDPDLAGLKVAGIDTVRSGQPPTDENGHGTQVTSIFAARGKNMIGIAPADIKIVDGRFLNASNEGDTDKAIQVLDFFYNTMSQVREQDKDALFIGNNSWGGDDFSQIVEDKMKRLSTFGYLSITSAGNNNQRNNDSQPYFPCNSKVVANTCVGASDLKDGLASFSDYGPASVHLLAPGVQIYGIVPGELQGGNYVSHYQRKDGTSQAVPHVTGVAALIWSINPKLSALDVHQILMKSVDPVPGAEAWVVSGGRLNAYRAVLTASGQNPSLADRSAAGGDGGCSLRSTSDPSTHTPVGLSWWLLFATAACLLLALRFRMKRNQKHI